MSKLDLRQKTNSWQKSKSKTQAKWSLKLLAKTWSVGQGWDERRKIIKKKKKKKEKGEGEIRRKQIIKPNSIEKGGTTHKSRVSCHSSVSHPQPHFTSVREASYLSLSLSPSLPLSQDLTPHGSYSLWSSNLYQSLTNFREGVFASSDMQKFISFGPSIPPLPIPTTSP